jgi:hypothetical protein
VLIEKTRKSSCSSGLFAAYRLSAAGGKALAAVYGTILSRLEGNLSGLSAFGADGIMHLARTAGSAAGLPGLTAGLAAGGLVLESLFGVEFLFTGGENELSTTVLAYQRFVFVHDQATPKMLIGDSPG